MARWQEPEWLSLVALGSDCGQDLADGSQMSAGIHRRWDFDNELDFPRGGFDIFRREHLQGKEWCAVFYPKQGGGITLSGSDNGPQFVVSASGDAHFQGGCGEQRDTSIFLPGAQMFSVSGAAMARAPCSCRPTAHRCPTGATHFNSPSASILARKLPLGGAMAAPSLKSRHCTSNCLRLSCFWK
ncbi:MAG: hypothetical protein ABI700_32875 [Chloroflexota bacterium]